MKNILLVLSTTRQSPKTAELAFEKARSEKSNLTALFILDSGMPDSIFEKLTDIGFTGEKPSRQLHDAILAEYRERGRKKLDELEKFSEKTGVFFESIIREGDFASECISVIKDKKIDFAIITRKKRSSLSRFIFGSPLDAIKKETQCEIIVVDE